VSGNLLGRLSDRFRLPAFPGWRFVLLGCVIYTVGGGVFYQALPIFFLPLKHDFGVSSATISLLYAAARLEGGFEGPLVGYLISRFGPRAVILVGVVMSGGGLFLLTLAPDFWSFFFVYICVVSLGYNAGFYHPISTLVNNWFIRNRGVAFAWISASGAAGGVLLAPILATLIHRYGWRTGAVAAGGIVLLVSLPAAWPLRATPESMGLCPDGGAGAAPRADRGAEPHAGEPEFSVREALRTRAFWQLLASISMRLFVTVALTTHIVPILVWGGMTEQWAAYMVSLYSFVYILSTLGLGWIADRWRKSLVCAVGLLPMTLAMVGLVFSQATPWLYFLAVGLSIAMGTASLNWALIGDLFGRQSYPTIRGVMGVGYGVMTFLSPIYAGWVFDLTGSYTPVLITFIAIALATALGFAGLSAPPPLRRGSPST